jgi:hypothetical protein
MSEVHTHMLHTYILTTVTNDGKNDNETYVSYKLKRRVQISFQNILHTSY